MQVSSFLRPLLQVLFPHNCIGCCEPLFDTQKFFCRQCLEDFPFTHFEKDPNNPVSAIFAGRLPVQRASSWLFFAKNGITQNIIHELKYRGNQDVGVEAGKMMAQSLEKAGWWKDIDVLVPLPLNRKKLLIRGFNQAEVLCRGLSWVSGKPIEEVAVMRTVYTETQTKKSRIQRWQNVAEVFDLLNHEHLAGKHALLVDDVITTGATLDACGQVLIKVPGLKLSVATLAYASAI